MGFFNRTKLASDAEVVDLLRTMHVRMGALEAEMQKLAAGHQSLRGFVYARVRKAQAGDEPESVDQDAASDAPATAAPARPKDTAQMSREELRRTLVSTGRFIPGRPPRHE